MNGTHLTPSLFAFIQARSGSTRFPCKVLKSLPLNSTLTILDHIYFRIKQVLPEDRIVFLIPEHDDKIKVFLQNRKYLFFEGDESNVRERYISAANYFQAEQILRLTGDNPFVDIFYLELLCEALTNTDNDLASFHGLPLGMGGEIFTKNALCAEPKDGLTNDHLEHVSLHIKEDPIQFKFKKLDPLLTKDEIEICSKIRLTIDELNDYKVAENVYNLLNRINPNFGIKEVISLLNEKSELFQLNSTIEQISFKTNQSKKKQNIKIRIIYAPPEKYGSGHFERCKILYTKLSSLGYDITMSSDFQNEDAFDLLIIDHRDEIVPEIHRQKKILLLDNFGPDRYVFNYHDVLPHPELNFSQSCENILFPGIIDLLKNSKQLKIILSYAGGRNQSESNTLDEFLFKLFGNEFQYLRIGGEKNIDLPVQVISRLPKKEFLKYLAESAYFATYFGQSLMEAIYLQKKTIIYSISDYHSELGEYFSQKSGLLYIGSLLGELRKIQQNEICKSNLNFENTGYQNLINKIQSLLKL